MYGYVELCMFSLFSPNLMFNVNCQVRDENIPGLAMTRSFGDTVGKRAGAFSGLS